MTDLPKAHLLPGIPFEAKARKKRRKGKPAAATTCTPSFEDVRPFLSSKPLHGLTPPPAAPQPPQAEHEPPAKPGTDRDENMAA